MYRRGISDQEFSRGTADCPCHPTWGSHNAWSGFHIGGELESGKQNPIFLSLMVTLLDFRKRRSPRVFRTNCPAGAIARPGAAMLFGLHTFVHVLSPGVDAARMAWHDRDSLASAAGLLERCSGHRGPTRLFPMTPECRGEGTIQAATASQPARPSAAGIWLARGRERGREAVGTAGRASSIFCEVPPRERQRHMHHHGKPEGSLRTAAGGAPAASPPFSGDEA